MHARQAFRTDQFKLEGNFRTHYLHIGPEILSQSKNQIQAFCNFVGTGGAFGGCVAAFMEANPQIHCYVVEPGARRCSQDNPSAVPTTVPKVAAIRCETSNSLNQNLSMASYE